VNSRTRRANKLVADRLAVRVIVTQTDGQAFAGVITDLDDGWLLLREAEQLGPQGSRVAVDGELLLPRDRISFIQRP
jgi:hypothetical protein